ncbi:MFS transporter [bacterium]|nr:MFS transporter [bacterium]
MKSSTTAQTPRSFQTGNVITTGTVHAVHDTYTAFLPALLPVFISNLGLSRAEAGMLTVFTQAPSLTQPLIGHLSDRVNLNYWVMLAPALSAILMSMLGIISGYFWLAVLLTLAGFSSAMLHAIGPVITGRFAGRNLGRGMSVWMLGGELGRTLGPIVIVTALAHMTIRSLPWLSIAGIVASVLLFLRFKDLPGPSASSAESVHWRTAIAKMGYFMIPLVGIITVRAFLISGLTTYLPTFLTDEGESLWFAGASLTILQAAGAAGAYICGSLSDSLGRRKVLFILMATAPVFTFLFLNTGGWVRLPLLLGLGFTVISTTPVVMAIVQENFPDNRALANGVYMSLSFAIRSAAILIVGLIGDRYGLGRAIGISGVIMAAGILFILILPKTVRDERD